MHNRINVWGMTLPTYGTITLLGMLLVSLVGIIIVWHRKLCIEMFIKLECVGGVTALIGAKLWDMIMSSIETGDYVVSMDSFMNSGLSFYGGLLFGALSVWIASFILRIDFNRYAKNLIFLIPLLHGIWKVGCFMGGCCYGVPYHGPGAVIFPEGVKAPAGMELFPIQIVEANVLFGMAIVCYIKGKMKQWRHPVLEYIGSYAVVRFLLEFFRWHEKEKIFSGAHVVSLVCACVVALSIYLDKRKRIKRKTDE